jgi:hypothetical protein
VEHGGLGRSKGKRSGRVLAGLSLGVAIAAASGAEARTITVRWRFSAPDRAAGFRVHVGSAPGEYTRTVDVGKPEPDADGVYRATLDVADDVPSFVAVSAYGARGEESPRSNESVRAPAPAGAEPGGRALGTPGQPRVVSP